MRPVSDRFLDAVRGSHRMVAEARIVAPGQTGVVPTGTVIPILDGDVQLDAAADVRSTIDLTTSGDRWPADADGLLTPYGNELHVRRGIQLDGGTIEWVSLGYHRIDTVEQPDAPRGPVRIAGSDRMAGLIDGRLETPRQYAATDLVGDVVDELVTEIYPTAVIEWDDATDAETLGRALVIEEDRHAGLADLVTAYGKIWYWDHRGYLVIKDPPDPARPVYVVNSAARGVLVRLSRQLTRKGVYNAVVASGEGADTAAPVRAVVTDDAETSPTRWGGPFGRVPKFYSSPVITSQDQAEAAARSLLLQESGLPYSVEFGTVANPALEPYDPLRVRYPGRSERHLIDRLTVPLTARGDMSAATRQQAVYGGN
jgi:hypothetical protein